MIIPIALSKDGTYPEYDTGDYVESVKKQASEVLRLYREVEDLKTQWKPEDGTKETKGFNKKLNVCIRSKDAQLSVLMKKTDYAAMTMISFPDADIRSYLAFNNFKHTIDKPILVRGIVSGSYIDYAKSQGLDYYFIETGYFGNYSCEGNPNARKFWHRIVKNAMQHSKVLNVPGDRWERLCKYDTRLQWKGWKKSGSKILVVAPSEKPCKYYGINHIDWINETVAELKKYTDREIVVREKGSRNERTSTNLIYDAFDKDVYAVVTYNSIAAAEAVAYGIPAFAMAPTVAAPVVLNNLSKIETPYYPDPEFVHRWVSSLAYGQYNLEELLTGDAWRMVLENEQRETISY
jgi:hypothetical protein